MSQHAKMKNPASGGFTIVELLIAMTLAVVGLVALSGVLVTTSQAREAAAQRYLVLEATENIMEEIRAADPATILAGYNTKTFDMAGIDGTNTDGTVIKVDIVAADPNYLQVTVIGSWQIGSSTHSLQLYTEIMDPEGL